MATYSNEEYVDMLICYGYCNCVSTHARTEYMRRYPDRRVPDVSVFDGVYRRLRETGSVSRRRTDLGRPRVTEEAIPRRAKRRTSKPSPPTRRKDKPA
ncbi:unnamed protein product [Colias eurytheme]|nr:unnamed protein product [Colias eurytheme]